MTRIYSSDVNRYIKSSLKNSLKKDAQSKNHKLLTEADLQAATYYHIRKKFKEDPSLVILNQVPVKTKGENKFPDLIVFRHTNRKLKPHILIEFKEKSAYSRRHINHDVEKLEQIEKGLPKVHRHIFFLSNEKGSVIKKKQKEENRYLSKNHPTINLVLFGPKEKLSHDRGSDWEKERSELKKWTK